MSASYVRSKAREWAVLVSAETGVPFYDTVNVYIEPAEDVWFTLTFAADTMTGTFCERGMIETGSIRVLAVARAGIGDTGATDALERVTRALFHKIDTTQRLGLLGVEPILEESAGTADANYRVSTLIEYQHSL